MYLDMSAPTPTPGLGKPPYVNNQLRLLVGVSDVENSRSPAARLQEACGASPVMSDLLLAPGEKNSAVPNPAKAPKLLFAPMPVPFGSGGAENEPSGVASLKPPVAQHRTPPVSPLTIPHPNDRLPRFGPNRVRVRHAICPPRDAFNWSSLNEGSLSHLAPAFQLSAK